MKWLKDNWLTLAWWVFAAYAVLHGTDNVECGGMFNRLTC